MACARPATSSAMAAAPRRVFSPPVVARRTRGAQSPTVPRKPSAAAHAGKVVKVNGEQLEREVTQRDRPVVIDFFATWCGPCLLLAHELDKAAEILGDEVKFFKLDVDENPVISSQLRILGLPTLVFLPGPADGARPGVRAEGLMPAEEIVRIAKDFKQAPAATAS